MAGTMTSSTVHLRSGHWITRKVIGRKIADLPSKTNFIGAEFGLKYSNWTEFFLIRNSCCKISIISLY